MRRLNAFAVRCVLGLGLAAASMTGMANQPQIQDTTIAQVSVNGGSDTENVGVTCVRVTGVVSSTCQAGWVAIKNNNKLLIAAALQAKATGALVWFYYDDAGATSLHCPGHVFTPCTVISISVK